ncbi:hypothetical protein LTR62_003958 [Meristemomyces frigidus]|uniref:Uncharacterized protein n=1 Tax=Meristemomyces frigidus TaxID=1508187 RepID=A0AAN7THW7_9PEZI|nr:hypothetical protein LTR62_003958 [Meristemomyces frigidus]
MTFPLTSPTKPEMASASTSWTESAARQALTASTSSLPPRDGQGTNKPSASVPPLRADSTSDMTSQHGRTYSNGQGEMQTSRVRKRSSWWTKVMAFGDDEAGLLKFLDFGIKVTRPWFAQIELLQSTAAGHAPGPEHGRCQTFGGALVGRERDGQRPAMATQAPRLKRKKGCRTLQETRRQS